jgi:signal transduction histidine kinase
MKEYIKDHLGVIFLFIGLYVIVASVYVLHELPLESLWYMMQLGSVLFVGVGLVHFYFYNASKGQLISLKKDLRGITKKDLPKASSSLESAYQALIFKYSRQIQILEEKANTRQKETLEYYTMWMHQMKTPLSALDLLLQIEQGEQKVFMEQEVFKIKQYVEMALEYVRIQELAKDLSIEKVSLDKLIKKIAKKYSVLFIHKRNKLVLDVKEEELLSDEKWLGFILEQILSNALKYTHNGTISISVRVDDYLKQKVITIEDTGIGIREEDLPRIFEKGFTGSNGRLDKQSTGIGLYLCERVAKELGHKLYVYSKTGEGTRIEIVLTQHELALM